MPFSVRTRFEIFKRDDFTCQYCGRKSPEVVLEADHIVPQCDGGSDDVINGRTSCWECNHGKAGVPLAELVTGEDPHDRSILLLERERQLREYNAVLEHIREQRDIDVWELWGHWQWQRGFKSDQELNTAPKRDTGWLRNVLDHCPKQQIQSFMDYAIFRGFDDDLRYVKGCVRNWRQEEHAPPALPEQSNPDDTSIDEQIAAYVRATALEEVLVAMRDEEAIRRNVGHCQHSPTCGSFIDCVLLSVRMRFDAS
jgi:hypothetical protein